MKKINAVFILLCFAICLGTVASAKEMKNPSRLKGAKTPHKTIPKSSKGAKVVPGSFKVVKVTFKKVPINNKTHLAAAVVFNKNINASTVKENVNFRMLKKNENHYWVDASTQNNIVRIRPNFITWVCGAPLKTGVYIMHLRGTIKSADGIYLDCNGDGKGEGGNLPAYESQMYQAQVRELEEIDPDRIDGLLDQLL